MVSGSASSELKKEITALCNEIWGKLAKPPAASYGDLLTLWQEAHGIYLETAAASLEKWAEQHDSPNDFIDKIQAEMIVVEIVDKNTGKIYRRNLPVQYCETGNGVILAGETMEGQPSQIAFFSETALSKINDLCGKGPDAPRCGETEDHK